MTTIYVPRLIESAEQAEALPRKTLVFDNETDGWIQPLIKVGRDDGDWFWMGDAEWEPHPGDLVGWTALVPIEAEEETTGALVNRAGDIHWEESRRLVTPWETA